MKRDNWTVGDYGIRPAGKPTQCFYCGIEKGGIHKEGCVIRKRTIVMEMKINIVMDVPEDWDEAMCNFHKNEGTWCANNILHDLNAMKERMNCLCDVAEFKYLREANEDDEKSQNKFVRDIPA